MVPFFIAVAIVILAVAVVVLRALREKRALADRLGSSATVRRPEAAGPGGQAGRWS